MFIQEGAALFKDTIRELAVDIKNFDEEKTRIIQKDADRE